MEDSNANDEEAIAADEWSGYLATSGVVALDTDADDVADTILLDTDADAIADTVIVDTDADQVPDTVVTAETATETAVSESEQAWAEAMAPAPDEAWADTETTYPDSGVPGEPGLDTEEEFPELGENDVPTDEDLQDAAEDVQTTAMIGTNFFGSPYG